MHSQHASFEIVGNGLRITKCSGMPEAVGEVFPWERVVAWKRVSTPKSPQYADHVTVYPDRASDRATDVVQFGGRINRSELDRIHTARTASIRRHAKKGTLDLRVPTRLDKKHFRTAAIFATCIAVVMGSMGLFMHFTSGSDPIPGERYTGVSLTKALVSIPMWWIIIFSLFAVPIYLGTRKRLLRANADGLTIELPNRSHATVNASDIESITLGRFSHTLRTRDGAEHRMRIVPPMCIEALFALGYLTDVQRDEVTRKGLSTV